MKFPNECPRCVLPFTNLPRTSLNQSDSYHCDHCPKVDLYKGHSCPWLTVYTEPGTKVTCGWSLVIPGLTFYKNFHYQKVIAYDGHEYQPEIPLPPDHLIQLSQDEIISWVKTMLIFK